MDIADKSDKMISGLKDPLSNCSSTYREEEATNLMLKMLEMGLCMKQCEKKPHRSYHGQKPSQDKKRTDKGKRQEKQSQVEKIWVSCSSSCSEVEKTCIKIKSSSSSSKRQLLFST